MTDLRIEAELARDVLLMDVSERLPRLRPYPPRSMRIDRLIVHHSGALGRPGLEGMIASARYTITPKPKGPGGRGFAYTFWIPFHRPTTGPLLVYRGNPDEVRSAHTSGWNDRGVAVVLQGNLAKTGGMSASQGEALEALIPWAVERYDLMLPDGLTYHRECTGKPTCPSPAVERWIEAYRVQR